MPDKISDCRIWLSIFLEKAAILSPDEKYVDAVYSLFFQRDLSAHFLCLQLCVCILELPIHRTSKNQNNIQHTADRLPARISTVFLHHFCCVLQYENRQSALCFYLLPPYPLFVFFAAYKTPHFIKFNSQSAFIWYDNTHIFRDFIGYFTEKVKKPYH